MTSKTGDKKITEKLETTKPGIEVCRILRINVYQVFVIQTVPL